jgi:hypothetical protein
MIESSIHTLVADALRRAPPSPEAQADAVLAALKAAGLTIATGQQASADVLGGDDWRAVHQAEIQIIRGQGVVWSAIRAKYP